MCKRKVSAQSLLTSGVNGLLSAESCPPKFTRSSPNPHAIVFTDRTFNEVLRMGPSSSRTGVHVRRVKTPGVQAPWAVGGHRDKVDICKPRRASSGEANPASLWCALWQPEGTHTGHQASSRLGRLGGWEGKPIGVMACFSLLFPAFWALTLEGLVSGPAAPGEAFPRLHENSGHKNLEIGASRVAVAAGFPGGVGRGRWLEGGRAERQPRTRAPSRWRWLAGGPSPVSLTCIWLSKDICFVVILLVAVRNLDKKYDPFEENVQHPNQN